MLALRVVSSWSSDRSAFRYFRCVAQSVPDPRSADVALRRTAVRCDVKIADTSRGGRVPRPRLKYLIYILERGLHLSRAGDRGVVQQANSVLWPTWHARGRVAKAWRETQRSPPLTYTTRPLTGPPKTPIYHRLVQSGKSSPRSNSARNKSCGVRLAWGQHTRCSVWQWVTVVCLCMDRNEMNRALGHLCAHTG